MATTLNKNVEKIEAVEDYEQYNSSMKQPIRLIRD